MNIDRERVFTCGQSFSLVKQIASEWKVVPFAEGADIFYAIAYSLKYGDSQGYSIKPEHFEKPLTPGVYRVVTDVWYDNDYSTKFAVWAEFSIDKNAELQETIEIPGSWYGNFDGAEMTLEQMKQIAEWFVVLNRVLTVEDDFADYKGLNFSSSFDKYNMLYPVAGEAVSLHVLADVGGAVNKINIHRPIDGANLEIDAASYLQIDKFINGVFTPVVEPVGIVRSELTAAGYDINYVFVLSQNDRKALDGVDNGELSTVYASYNDGDAIYCMQYSFERQTHNSEWAHGEPMFWNGIAIDVAAYIAREYYSEKYGDSYDDIGVSWAQNIVNDYSLADGRRDWEFVDFYIGRNGGEENGGDIPTLITLGSPDGESHWEVVGFNGAATDR
jgi:hypothetical protein